MSRRWKYPLFFFAGTFEVAGTYSTYPTVRILWVLGREETLLIPNGATSGLCWEPQGTSTLVG